MRRIPFSRIFLPAGVIVCLFTTYTNYKYNKKFQQRELSEKVQWMKMQDAVSIHPVNPLTVRNTQGDTIPLTAVAQDGARVGIYAHRSQCAECWRTVATNIRNICKSFHVADPCILFDGFRPADIRIMSKEIDSLQIESFITNEYEDTYLHRLAATGKTYVFLLNMDSTMSSVMYYDDAIVPVMKEYIKSFSLDSLYAGHIRIDNPHIRLGTIPCRKEFKLHYIIKNNSKDDCHIMKIIPSCTCLQIENSLERIAPGQTADLNVVFFSDVFGSFYREIEIYTDTRDEPYILRVEGNCQ